MTEAPGGTGLACSEVQCNRFHGAAQRMKDHRVIFRSYWTAFDIWQDSVYCYMVTMNTAPLLRENIFLRHCVLTEAIEDSANAVYS